MVVHALLVPLIMHSIRHQKKEFQQIHARQRSKHCIAGSCVCLFDDELAPQVNNARERYLEETREDSDKTTYLWMLSRHCFLRLAYMKRDISLKHVVTRIGEAG